MWFLADSIDGELFWIVGGLLAALICGLASLVPSYRGHWSGLVLATPATVIGAALVWSVVTDSWPSQMEPPFWVFFPAPLALGIISVICWTVGRKTRRERR